MINPRRGFLAFIGGAALSGVVTRSQAATCPTLLVPSGSLIRPGSVGLVAAHDSQVQAFLHVRDTVDAKGFSAWMFIGMRMAENAALWPREGGDDV